MVLPRWHGRAIPAPSKFRSPLTLDPTLRAAVVALRPVLLVLARRMCASEADAADVVHDTLESALQAGDRLHAVEKLEPEFREVFTLHAFERRSYKDIALALDIPQNTVGTRLLRARRKLRVLLLGGREEVGT